MKEQNKKSWMKIKLLVILLVPLISKSQTFEKSDNPFTKEHFVKYYHQGAGIIIQTVSKFPTDTTSLTYYEIGLIVFRKSSFSDDFMKKGGVIVFDDKTFIILHETISSSYYLEGKHAFSLKHILSSNELNQLQTKKIDYFLVGDKDKPLDKWQKQDILKAFNEIIRL